MKDIWCTFKAGSLNWEEEKKKRKKKNVSKYSFKKIKIIIWIVVVFTHLRHVFTHNQTRCDSVSKTKRLMHLQSICNVLIMSVTYFSLSVTALRFFCYIFWNSKVEQFRKTWWMDCRTDIIRQNHGNLPGSQRSMHNYWAVQAGLLTPLTFARHHLSPLAAFTSGAYFLHNGRQWQWICKFYTANFKDILGGL